MISLLRTYRTDHSYADHPLFNPAFTPEAMLRLGVFDGKYFEDDPSEVQGLYVRSNNMFAPYVSLGRKAWIENGWITEEDPLGWFQWYLRFHRGRRVPKLDEWQIKRQISFARRHGLAVLNSGNGNLNNRKRQRQALLHWAAWPIPDVEK